MENLTNYLLKWYQENKRILPWRDIHNSYYTWISEIMLQQTRVEAVIPYYLRFIDKCPTLKDLANLEEDELLKLWEGLGYYSRVRNMQKLARILVEQGYSTLPNDYDFLLSLPGIGKYTAGAILSIGYNQRSVAIDGNVYRILGRVYEIEEDISKNSAYKIYEEKYKSLLPNESYGDFTQSFMDLGSRICLPKNPKCNECPIKNFCASYKDNLQEKYPVKNKKLTKKEENRVVLLYVYKNKIGIRKRDSKGLLASLYEFPNVLESEFDEAKYKNKIRLVDSKHVFSHIIWNMKGYLIKINYNKKELQFVSKEELETTYSIPSAFKVYEEYFKKVYRG